jgi:phosphatidylserine decarboxylase
LEFLQLLSFVLLVFFVFVFRNPERELPNFDANSVLCPVDGEVVSIEALTDSEYAYKVSIDTTYKDVGILRAPMNASLIFIGKKYGTRLSLDNPIAIQTNENVRMVFEDSNANKVQLVHTVKQSLCGVVIDVEQDISIAQSARYGIMVNGITHIYLPQNFRLNLILGEKEDKTSHAEESKK